MGVFDTLGTIANQAKNVTLPGLVTAAACALLAWPPHTVDTLTIPTVGEVEVHDPPSWPLKVAPKPGDPLYKFTVTGQAACDTKPRTALVEWKTVLERQNAAVQNQETLDDADQRFLKCINEEAVLASADDTLLKNTNDLIAQRLAERATILGKVQTYGLELSPVAGNFRQMLAAKDEEIQQLQVQALAFTRVQQERKYRVNELNRQEKEVKALLNEPGRLRPKQSFDDILTGLSNHVIGFTALVIAWGLLLSPLNRAAFSLLYSSVFDGMWDMLRSSRVPDPELQAIRAIHKPYKPGPNFALPKLAICVAVAAVIMVCGAYHAEIWTLTHKNNQGQSLLQHHTGTVFAAMVAEPQQNTIGASPAAQAAAGSTATDSTEHPPQHGYNTDRPGSDVDKPQLDPPKVYEIPPPHPPNCPAGNCVPDMFSSCPPSINCKPDRSGEPDPKVRKEEWVQPASKSEQAQKVVPTKTVELPLPADLKTIPLGEPARSKSLQTQIERWVFLRCFGMSLCGVLIAIYLPKVLADRQALKEEDGLGRSQRRKLLTDLRATEKRIADARAEEAKGVANPENPPVNSKGVAQTDKERHKELQAQLDVLNRKQETFGRLSSLMRFRNPGRGEQLVQLGALSQARDQDRKTLQQLLGKHDADARAGSPAASSAVTGAQETVSAAAVGGSKGKDKSDGGNQPDPSELNRKVCLKRLNDQWAKLSQPEYAIGMKTIAQSDYDALRTSFEADSQLCAGLLIPGLLLAWAILYTQLFVLPEALVLFVLLLGTMGAVITAVDLRHKYETGVDMLIAGSFLNVCSQKAASTAPDAGSMDKLIAAAINKLKVYRKTDLRIVSDQNDSDSEDNGSGDGSISGGGSPQNGTDKGGNVASAEGVESRGDSAPLQVADASKEVIGDSDQSEASAHSGKLSSGLQEG